MTLPSLVQDNLSQHLHADKPRKFKTFFETLAIDRAEQLNWLFEAVAHSKNKMVSYLNNFMGTTDDEQNLLAQHAIVHDNRTAFNMFASSLSDRDEHFLALQLTIDHGRTQMFKDLLAQFPLSVADHQLLVVHAWDKEMDRKRNMDFLARMQSRHKDSFSSILACNLSDQELMDAIDGLDFHHQNGHEICMHAAFMFENTRPAVHDHMFNKGVNLMKKACAQIVTRSQKR